MTNPKTKSFFDPIREESEVLNSLRSNPELYHRYMRMNKEWQERFLQFLTGAKTLPVTYDIFFKKIFHPDIHRDRLEDFLSSLLGNSVLICDILPSEETLLEGNHLIIMDILVRLTDGSLVLVEIQKNPYDFPAERISCYSADLLLRQYSQIKGKRGRNFRYKDLKKVYTIILFEKSTALFQHSKKYLHHGKVSFDTDLNLELLQEFYLIALDVFKKTSYHKEKGKLAGWLSLLATETAKDAEANMLLYPWLQEIYQEMAAYRKKPEEVMTMYSEIIYQLDRNSVQYMVEEQQKKLEKQKRELAKQQNKLAEQRGKLAEQRDKLAEQQDKLAEQQKENDILKQENARLRKQLESRS